MTFPYQNTADFLHEPVSLRIEQPAAADQDAAGRLWAHSLSATDDLRSRKSPSTRRIYDEEDGLHVIPGGYKFHFSGRTPVVTGDRYPASQ